MLNDYRHHLIAIRRSPNTVRTRCVYVRQLLAAFPNVAKIRPQLLEDFVYSDPNWKPETINVCISSVRSFMAWAHATGRIPTNPAANLTPLKVPLVPQRMVPDENFLAAMPGASLEDQALMMLGGEGGLRRSELAGAHSRHRTGDRLTVTGKGNKTRIVGISPELCTVLDALERDGPCYYFRGRFGGHVHPSTIYERTRRLLAYNPHAMRHRAITTVYKEAGRDVFLTQKFAGHESSNTTMVYVHFEDDELAVASEATRFSRIPAELPAAA